MPTHDHSESASSSSTAPYDARMSLNSDIDDRISALLASIRLSALRNSLSEDADEECLRKIHRQLDWLVSQEPDDRRRRRLRRILPAANCVREQVFVLRRCLHGGGSTTNYIPQVHAALKAIMQESFDEEYRKLANIVGVLDAVAELLIFEVDVFGLDCSSENRTIKKLIANTLTNLTFGNARSKRRLCSHPKVIEYVTRIVEESYSLAQVYSGLLRNLSWMADGEMSICLSRSVPALARASLQAYRSAGTKCLCATLSALWNLASHSKNNKKALCEEEGFLAMLVDLLSNDTQQIALVEPASGVLKYASMYMAVIGTDQCLSISTLHLMIIRLVDLLTSESFTIVGNALGVLTQLLAKDYQLRAYLRSNNKAMQILNGLRGSRHDVIRSPVRTVWGYLISSEIHTAYSTQYPSRGMPESGYHAEDMSSSYGGTATATPTHINSSRLLKLRSAQSHTSGVMSTAGASGMETATDSFRYTPVAQHGFAPRPGDTQQHYASLPRQFYQHGKMGRSTVDHGDEAYFEQPEASSTFASGRLLATYQTSESTSHKSSAGNKVDSEMDNEQKCDNNSFDETELSRLNLRITDDVPFDVEDSVRCTRCTSTQSLSSMLQGQKSAWESCNDSAADSTRLSPASATDLPDSPTQCLAYDDSRTLSSKDFSDAEVSKDDFIEKPSENKREAGDTDIRNEKQQGALQESSSAESSAESKKDKHIEESRGSADDSGDYGSFAGKADTELLKQSIEAAMPKRIEINEEFLADMIEQAQPKPSPHSRHHGAGAAKNYSRASTARVRSGNSSSKAEDDEFLLQSIASVLPQSSPRREMFSVGSPPKKARAMTDEAARTSSGPKSFSRAAHSTSQNCMRHSQSRPDSIQLKRIFAKFPNSEYELETSLKARGGVSPSTVLFKAALKSSSFIQLRQTTEKIRDASLLKKNAFEERNSSEDNFSPLDDNLTIEKAVPLDVDEEFQAEELIIDCRAVSERDKQTGVRPARKTSASQRSMKHEKRASEEDMVLPAPSSSHSSPKSCQNVYTILTPKHMKQKNSAPVNAQKQLVVFPKPLMNSIATDENQAEKMKDVSCNGGKKAEKTQNSAVQRSFFLVSSLPRPKWQVVSKERCSIPQRSASGSRIEIGTCGTTNLQRVATIECGSLRRDWRTSSTPLKSSLVDCALQKQSNLVKMLQLNRQRMPNAVTKTPQSELKERAVDVENMRDEIVDNNPKKSVKQMLISTV